jgi:peptide deformylase
MAILKIYKYGEDILRKVPQRVNFNLMEKKLPKIINDMTHTCLAMRGVGLAAPQVGLDLSLAVIMFPVNEEEGKEQFKRYVLINPEISLYKGTTVSTEGCLSFPGLEIQVERAEQIKVKYLNENGLPVVMTAKGYLAIILQHEIDHLYGKLFIDRLKGQKLAEAKKKLKELSADWN